MKKFLLGVVFIIPIIVMIAISAATSIIATAASPIPSAIVIGNEEGIVLEDGAVVELELTDTERYITIEIFPVFVQDDSVEYTFDEESGDGRVLLERVDDTIKYKLLPQSAGAVSVTLRAGSNINLARSIVFVVNTKEITGISIYDGEGNDTESISILKPTSLFAAISPMVALESYNLTWSSSDEDIVRVSANGVVSPVSRGKAYVSVSALDKTGKTHTDTALIDASGALVRSDKIYASEAITSDWLYRNIIISPSASLSVINTDYIVYEGNNSVNVRVEPCKNGDIGFQNCSGVMYTRTMPYFVEIGYLDQNGTGVIEGAIISSGDSSVISVDGNVLIAQKGGTAVITASYGGKTASETFTVKENPAVLGLNLTSSDAKLGIKLARTWGLYWFGADNSLISTYQMSATDNTDVVWSVDDETKAEISPEGLITFKEGCRGRKVTVSAKVVVNNRLTGVGRSFTFDMQNDNAVNVYSFDELCRANDLKNYVLVLQHNIDSGGTVRLNNSLYGNGFTVSAESRGCEDTYNQDALFHYTYDEDPAHYDTIGTIVVEDVVLVGRDEYEKSTHVGIVNSRNNKKTVFRYIVAKHFYVAVLIRSCADTLIEGCILGDNSHHSLSIIYTNETSAGDAKVTMRNNVIKMSKGPAIVLVPDNFGTENFGKNIIPYFIIEGFLDIYNWKSEAELGPAFNVFEIQNIDLGGFIDPEYLADAINDGLAELMKSKKMSHLFYTDKKGNKFGSLGVFALGAMYKLDSSKIIVKNDALSMMEMPLSNIDGPAGILVDIVNAVASSKGMPINNSCYFVGYDFSGKDPEIKPGDAVPQTYELYERLQSGVQTEDPDQDGDDEDDYNVC